MTTLTIMEKEKIKGQKGGLQCLKNNGREYYSKMAKEAHKRRKELLKKLSKNVEK